MKIDYKKYPILECLSKGSLGRMPVFESDKQSFDIFMSTFVEKWKTGVLKFKKEINIVSNPFFEASEKSKVKLAELYSDIIVNDLADFEIQGTYCVGDLVIMIDYDIRQGYEDFDLLIFVFTKEGIPLCVEHANKLNYNVNLMWVSNSLGLNFKNKEQIEKACADFLFKVIILKMFKSYASVETKILKPNQKVVDIVCKYKNETKLDLIFLDSKWFTNLVKSDSFNVRGHFRLQPKKINGEMSKELIWISEFQKTGYTAPARMLS